jgi:hypothetical protein
MLTLRAGTGGRVRLGLALLAVAAIVCSFGIGARTIEALPVRWQPSSSSPIHWQWQIGTSFNVSTDVIPNVTVYDVDMFDTSAATVQQLHARGCKVIAYIDFGGLESGRPDSDKFPPSVIGSKMQGWPERWLDIRSSVVRQLLAARVDLAVSKGFDAIEPDNMESYNNNSGFPITAQDQIDFNIWIAQMVHSKGLSVGLKNDVGQAAQLQPYFDWALNEESYQYNEYQPLASFVSAGKAVFEVEYSGTGQFSTMNAMHINTLTKDLNLVGPTQSGYVRRPGIPDNQDTWTGSAPVIKPDFSLGASPSSQATVPGSGVTYSITVSPSNGFAQAVSLSVSGLPNGATAGFSPSSAATSSTLIINTTTSVVPGTYPLTIKGTSGSLVHTTGATVVINQTSGPTPPIPTGNTIGTVASVPKKTGAANEYDLFLKVNSTNVPGLSPGQLVWVAATTTDFPNLLTVGATLSGNLDHSLGWWVLKKS